MDIKPISRALAALLKTSGFKRRGLVWNRVNQDFIDVIDIQPDGYGKEFTINVGVMDKSIFELVWEKEVPIWARVWECTMESRIGRLMGSTLDVWWRYEDENVIEKVIFNTSNYAIPFIERMHVDEEQILEFENINIIRKSLSYPNITYMILLHRRGRLDDATNVMKALYKKANDGWYITACRIAEQLSIDYFRRE